MENRLFDKSMIVERRDRFVLNECNLKNLKIFEGANATLSKILIESKSSYSFAIKHFVLRAKRN